MEKEFPSLMCDEQANIWLVQPYIINRGYYMICLGTFNIDNGASGKGIGNIQRVNEINLRRHFKHMKKGFSVNIKQT